jgi:hypothetical protein
VAARVVQHLLVSSPPDASVVNFRRARPITLPRRNVRNGVPVVPFSVSIMLEPSVSYFHMSPTKDNVPLNDRLGIALTNFLPRVPVRPRDDELALVRSSSTVDTP